MFNFAHGAIAAGAAYLFYAVHQNLGLPWPLALLIVVAVFGPIGGLVMEALARPLAAAPQVAVIVVTIGLLLAIQGALFLMGT